VITKFPVRIPSPLRAILPWLVFSAAWILVLLIIAQFRMVWLCAGAGALLGFFTDCMVDIVAARSHQRELRREYRKRFLSSESEADPPSHEATARQGRTAS
jgi:hypothetical protein